MNLKRAINIINYEPLDKVPTKKEQLEAYQIFFKEKFNVDIQNQDGSYKTMSTIIKEANKYMQERSDVNEL